MRDIEIGKNLLHPFDLGEPVIRHTPVRHRHGFEWVNIDLIGALVIVSREE